ncbi:uncharacterized protein LOC107487009 [Arachis duranensis]|uniref:Uncharacterized protein LOC107487009 n=1 Tax=Arachis duranensis TaxID=130453 RepID=A0A6P4D6B0_ARADU|nr:uncharacterized protein LOC107487009 [Arachis duranensis]
MLGLIETKKEVITKYEVARLWGSSTAGWEFVESVGMAGGLVLIWDDGVFQVIQRYKGERWLCVEGVLTRTNFRCAFCLVYGAHGREAKRGVWEELSYVVGLCQIPFCFLGDFNEILQVEDRKGVTSLLASSKEFKEWVHDMQLIDLPLTDRKYTWFRGLTRLTGPPRPFRSLDAWFTHEGFLRMVKDEWRNLGEAQFPCKLKALSIQLRQWHKVNFRDMDKRLMRFEEELTKLDNLVSDGVYDGTTEARRKALVSFCSK